MKPEWDAEGNPLNLLAAAEDAYEWLDWMLRCPGREREKLGAACDELRKFLDEAVE